MQSNLAPVIIPVYDRFEHIKKCIDSLLKCKLSSETILYIVSDAAYRDKDISKVNKVRNYLNEIIGFKELKLIIRETNYGVPRSYREAFKEIINKYGKIIALEDDIVVSSNFLEFINKGLDEYVDNKNIYSISGYSPTIKIPGNYKEEVFLTQRFNPWGYGIWLDRWKKLDYNLSDFDNFISQNKGKKKLDNIGNDIYRKLSEKNKYIPGDFANCYHIVKNNMYTVVPTNTLTNNIGFDGTGFHCRKSNNFIQKELYIGEKEILFPKEISPNKDIDKQIKKLHSNVGNSLLNILDILKLKQLALRIFRKLRK